MGITSTLLVSGYQIKKIASHVRNHPHSPEKNINNLAKMAFAGAVAGLVLPIHRAAQGAMNFLTAR